MADDSSFFTKHEKALEEVARAAAKGERGAFTVAATSLVAGAVASATGIPQAGLVVAGFTALVERYLDSPQNKILREQAARQEQSDVVVADLALKFAPIFEHLTDLVVQGIRATRQGTDDITNAIADLLLQLTRQLQDLRSDLGRSPTTAAPSTESSPLPTAPPLDLFISYARADAARVRPLAAALRARGLTIWIDESDIPTFDSITTRIAAGLGSCKALLAYYSVTYPSRRACQWELTAALLASTSSGGSTLAPHRILVLNPEPSTAHLEPSTQLRDALFAAPPAIDDRAALDALADKLKAALSTLPGSLGAIGSFTHPPWHGGTPLGSNRFVGRTRAFWQVHSALHANDAAVITARAAPGHAQVRGMGGIGKSLLAEEYALRFGAAYPAGIFFLKGTASLDDQRSHLAGSLGLPTAGLSLDQVAAALAEKLRSTARPYLWLVDDLPSGLSETERRTWFAPSGNGKTLITTRSRAYDGTGGVVDLGVLDPAEAYELLTSRRAPKGKSEEDAARELANELGYHALAVDVAGGALTNLPDETFATFLEKIRKPGADVLKAAAELAPELPNGHEKSITATLLASIALLDEPAYDFLRLASVLAPVVIPTNLVNAVLAPPGSPFGAAAVAKRVVDHSLADQAEGGYSVHALVSRTITLTDRNPNLMSELRERAIAHLNEALPGVEDIRKHESLRTHVTHGRHLATAASTLGEVQLHAWLGRHDYETGAYSSAAMHEEAVLEASRRVLGEQHPDTLRAHSSLAATLYAQGDLAGARANQEAVLEASRRVLGEVHPNTLAARNNLAQTLYAQGDLAGARANQEAVLEASRRGLGEEHSGTLTARNNLAQTLKAQGDLAGGRGHQEAVLEASRRVLGEEHPNALAARNNLAQTLKAQGDLAGACWHEEAVVEGSRRVLGEEHPNTLIARNNLAATLAAQGDLAGARVHQEAVMERSRRVLGEEHPNSLGARNNLAQTLKAQGDLAGARMHQEAVLEGSRRVVGEQHPDTLIARNNLAQTLKAQGDLGGARRHEEAVLEGSRRVLGEEHPDTLRSRSNLAGTLVQLGAIFGARSQLELVVAGRRKVLGADHPDTKAAERDLEFLRAELAAPPTLARG